MISGAFPEPGDDIRVKGFHAVNAGIGAQEVPGFGAQLTVPPAGLQLHNQRTGSPAEDVQDVREKGHNLLRVQEFHLLQLRQGIIRDVPVNAADAVQRIVVKDDDMAV